MDDYDNELSIIIGSFFGAVFLFTLLMITGIWGSILFGIIFGISVAAGVFNETSPPPPPSPKTAVFWFV